MQIVGLTEPVAKRPNRTITDLRSGVRDPNRVNVFVDGKFAFSLDVAQVVELGVRKGLALSAERLTELRAASEFGKLYQRTLEWALARPRSVREVEEYLRGRQLKRQQLNRQREREGKKILAEMDDGLMTLVVERLTEKGYVDDVKFAEYFVENRAVRKGMSLKKLRMELRRKGVSSAIVEQVLASGERNDAEEMVKIIAKKRQRYDDEKLIAYLVRQGFDYGEAKEVVETTTF